MSNYSQQVNNSYESVDECNISSASDYSTKSVEMSRERWNNNSMQRRSLNSSQEEPPHTYINPHLNVPSYTPDQYYNRKSNNHVYHPFVLQRSPNTPMYQNYQNFNHGFNYQNNNNGPSMYYNRQPSQPQPLIPLYLQQSPQNSYRHPSPSYNRPQNFRPNNRFSNHISPQNNHRFRPSYHNNNNFKPPQNTYRRQNFKKRGQNYQRNAPASSNVEAENEDDSSGDSNISEELTNQTTSYHKYLAEKDAKEKEALESSADCTKTDCSLMDCSTANETMESSINQTNDNSQITDASAIETADSTVPELESSVDHTMPNETCTDSEYLESSVANETFETSMNQTLESSVNESSFEPVQYVVTNQPILFPTVDSSGNPLLVQAENVQVFSMPLPFTNNNLTMGQMQGMPIPFTFPALPMIGADSCAVPGPYDLSVGGVFNNAVAPFQNSSGTQLVQESGSFVNQVQIQPQLSSNLMPLQPLVEFFPQSTDQSLNSTIDPNPVESSICDETKSDFDKTDKTVNASDDSGVKPGNESCDTADDSGVRAENESYEMNESDIRPEHESSGIVEDMKNPENRSDDNQELPKTTEINVQPYQLDEDSCNAVDHNISRSVSNEYSSDLSFNGKFNNLKNSEKKDSFNIPNMISQLKAQCENSRNIEESDNSLFNKSEISNQMEEETEEEKLRNESFEMLKNEDSTLMLYVNEKSPEPHSRSQCDMELPKIEDYEQEKIVGAYSKTKSAKNDVKIYNQLKKSLLGICPPPSVTNIPYSLDQITLLYNKNKEKAGDPIVDFKTEERDSFFKPTHSSNQVLEMTERINDEEMSWRELLHIKSHDVYYNRSTYCENIERMCLKYSEKFVGGETSSSINILKSPSSIKKKTEKFKLLTQSPGSRLSHLARRRTMFSSANLKSTLAPSTQPSISSSSKPLVSRQILVDKKKISLLQKSTKSPRKKTPGRRKTPKSAKRQSQLQLQSQQRSSTITSKRALFTSPPKSTSTVENRPSTINIPKISNDLSSRLQKSKRALFSPIDGKRKRTESADSNDSILSGNLLKPTKKAKLENSPNKFMKSLSFSVAGSGGNDSSSSVSDTSTLHRRSLFRTQSECLPQSQSNSQSQSTISFRQPMTEEHTRKLLWAVSSALANKQISKDHEKFKEHARLLVKLTRKIFVEFYDPLIKSTSNQMLKIANGMVFYVIQGRSYEDIYALTKEQYQKTRNLTKVSGYITQEEYEKNRRSLVRKNSTLLFQSVSTSSLNIHSSSENITDSNSRLSSNLGSTSKKSIISSDNTSSGSKTDQSNRSSSKNNENMGALRENFLRDNSGQKSNQRTSENDDKNKLFVGKTNSNLLKAKRQISF